nr:MAG TPA: hypothetical protein [Caudoviricetes sp.]
MLQPLSLVCILVHLGEFLLLFSSVSIKKR